MHAVNSGIQGPEVYYVTREKTGGSKQDGVLYGGKTGYYHIKPLSLYLGFNSYVASGKLDGFSPRGNPIRSMMTDFNLEGRIGYTFQKRNGLENRITPYISYGYLMSINKFLPPTPMTIKFTDTFKYYGVGCLMNLNPTPPFGIGVNFETQFSYDGKSTISDDPKFPDLTLEMSNAKQYKLELPLKYYFSENLKRFELTLVPFYQFRHYGGKERYPFNFIDTTFDIYGGRTEISYQF